jgi:hypothetical protein
MKINLNNRLCAAFYLENDKNLKHDSWRLEQLNRSTVDSSHPFKKFGTGGCLGRNFREDYTDIEREWIFEIIIVGIFIRKQIDS